MDEKVKAILTIVVTAAVNVANVLGYAQDADAWVNVVLSIASAVCVLWCWWKNQNLTLPAQQAQLVLNQLKNEQKAQRVRAKNYKEK